MRWDESLSVGDVQIDRQHQHLFNLLHAMEDQFQGRSSKSVATVMIGELRRYVEKHLRDEEWVLKSVNYSEYDAHCAMHRHFEAAVETLAGRLDADAPEAVLKDIHDLVMSWLTNHIRTVDMKYKPHLNT